MLLSRGVHPKIASDAGPFDNRETFDLYSHVECNARRSPQWRRYSAVVSSPAGFQPIGYENEPKPTWWSPWRRWLRRWGLVLVPVVLGFGAFALALSTAATALQGSSSAAFVGAIVGALVATFGNLLIQYVVALLQEWRWERERHYKEIALATTLSAELGTAAVRMNLNRQLLETGNAAGRFRALYDEVRGDLDRHRADRHWASFPALSELKHVTKVLNHWRRDPLGEGIVRHALTRSADFPHEVVLLAAATYLSDSGNDVRLVKTAPDVKTPDVELAVGGLRAKVDAKTSSKLLAPSALHQATLDRIAGNSVKHASKQIRGADAGVIALGGFRLSRAGRHSLADALRRELASYRQERAHIAGCLVFSVGADQDDVQPFLPPDPKRARLGVHERFASVVNPNLFQGIVGCVALANPDYRGPVPVLGPGGRGVGLQLRYEGALPIR